MNSILSPIAVFPPARFIYHYVTRRFKFLEDILPLIHASRKMLRNTSNTLLFNEKAQLDRLL